MHLALTWGVTPAAVVTVTYRVSPGTSGCPGSLACSSGPLPADTQGRVG